MERTIQTTLGAARLRWCYFKCRDVAREKRLPARHVSVDIEQATINGVVYRLQIGREETLSSFDGERRLSWRGWQQWLCRHQRSAPPTAAARQLVYSLGPEVERDHGLTDLDWAEALVEFWEGEHADATSISDAAVEDLASVRCELASARNALAEMGCDHLAPTKDYGDGPTCSACGCDLEAESQRHEAPAPAPR